MHISFFLIAVISATAIAKPLPDVQTNTPFGYFPSDFGAADATDSWGRSVIQPPGNDNTSPHSSNPAQMSLAGSDVHAGSDVNDDSNPPLITNGPAGMDPTTNHATREHPPGTSPVFRQFREFWCGAHEGRDQSVCCMGNKYGTFRPFTDELTCEKKQWVLGAGTETIGILDTRFLRYCHEPAYLYSCADYYKLYQDFQCYSDCDP